MSAGEAQPDERGVPGPTASALENVKRHTIAVDRISGGWQARCSCGWQGDPSELISRASESANEHREISSDPA
jgi:hypothetical protein